MNIISCFVTLCLLSAFGNDGVSANCHDVTTKLVAFETAMMGPAAPMISSVVQSAIGVDLLNAAYLEQYTCPWLASHSIADVGNSLRTSGLLRLLSDTACAVDAMVYSKMKTEFLNEHSLDYMPPAYREMAQACITTLDHIADMGFFNVNPAGARRIQLAIIMMGSQDPSEMLPTFPGNPGAYTQAQREAIMIADITVMLNKARALFQGHNMWPMIVSQVNFYSGGLVDLNNTASIDNLVRDLAGLITMDATYDFLSNTVMMPLLNFYYPILGSSLADVQNMLEWSVHHYNGYLEQGYVTQQDVDKVQLQLSTFETFLTALRATGVLDVHW